MVLRYVISVGKSGHFNQNRMATVCFGTFRVVAQLCMLVNEAILVAWSGIVRQIIYKCMHNYS